MNVEFIDGRIRVTRLLVSVTVVAFGSILLAGCGDPHAFDGVDQAVADVNPSRIGTVVVDEKLGNGHPLGGGASRHIGVLVIGNTEDAAAKAETAFAAAGFSHTGQSGWTRTKNGQYVFVLVTVRPTGAQIDRAGNTVPSGQTELLMDFSKG